LKQPILPQISSRIGRILRIRSHPISSPSNLAQTHQSSNLNSSNMLLAAPVPHNKAVISHAVLPVASKPTTKNVFDSDCFRDCLSHFVSFI
jgi:hypothetical protein